MPPDPASDSPVLFAYDGSDHAKAAIEQAGRELRTGRPALVLTVWQPLQSMPFAPLADDNDAAVVVLGSHGRSGVSYLAMGSVATAVAHHTKRPVMITRMA
jgi:hypothetical protein